MRRIGCLVAALLIAGLPSPANAQTTRIVQAVFTPSEHHNVVTTDGPAVDRYVLEARIGTTVAVSKDLGKPTPDAQNQIAVTVPELGTLAAGSYTVAVAAVGLGRTNFSSAVPFVVDPPLPTCTENGRPAVRLLVGDWTRNAKPGNSGRVLASLTQSQRPVVRIGVSLNGTEQGVLTGDDLRLTAGMYFTVPSIAGSYQVTVSARDAVGCEDGASRPMTLIVAP